MTDLSTALDGSGLPAGIWYEPPRRRFRVRIYAGTQVFHRSYHDTLADAIAALDRATAERDRRSMLPETLTDEQRLYALLGVRPADEQDPYSMNKLITIKQFVELYFEEGSRPSKSTVWRWIKHSGELPARRIGRAYYITTADAQAFVDKHGSQIKEEAQA